MEKFTTCFKQIQLKDLSSAAVLNLIVRPNIVNAIDGGKLVENSAHVLTVKTSLRKNIKLPDKNSLVAIA